MHEQGNPLDAVPQTLRQAKRWLRWRLALNPAGKLTKQPDRSTRSAELSDFQEVATLGADSEQGIGFALTDGFDIPTTTGQPARVYAFDLDGCRDPQTGAIEPWAHELQRLTNRSYTEVTPSGCGLRIWVAVRNPPATVARPKVKIQAPRAPNVPETKPVEFQLFGYGVPQYVTVTGAQLPGSQTHIETIDSLDPIAEQYGMQVSDSNPMPVLERGRGQPPDPSHIRAEILANDDGQAMIDGDWRKVLGDTDGDSSASAAFYRVAQVTLRAAQGHVAEALAFILAETAWGRGEIEDSADPSRYGRASWVAAELARIASKAGLHSNPFDDGQDFSEWEPPPKAEKPPQEGLLEPLQEFLATESNDVFLVYGVLPSQGLAQFFGDPGGGKTPFALSLAVHVAGGLPNWFGHEVDLHGPVVYMIGEDRAGIRRRMKAELEMHELPDTIPLHVTKRPGDLSDPGDTQLWIDQINAIGDRPKLLIVDTQSRNFGKGNENATEDMNVFVHHVQAVADLLGCLVLLVHHTGHKEKDRARGSMVLHGALDACYRVQRRGKLSVTATSTKAKNWADPEPLRGRLQVSQVGTDRKNRPVTAVALIDKEPDAKSVLVQIASENPTEPGPGQVYSAAEERQKRICQAVHQLDGEPVSLRKLSEVAGVGRTSLARELGEMTHLVLARQKAGGGPNPKRGGPNPGGGGPNVGRSVYLLTDEGLKLGGPNLDHFLT